MPKQLPIRVQDYYELNPSIENSSGDIWSGLPTFGMLGSQSISGIVITPACDLTNRKVETATYLPVIPVKSYFGTSSFLPDIVTAMQGQLRSLHLEQLAESLQTHSRFVPPNDANLERLITTIQEIQSQPNIGNKERLATDRVLAGIRILKKVSNPELVNVDMQDVKLLLGEGVFNTVTQRIVTNAFRVDIHFLPHDEQPEEWSCTPGHSVVLFRYPFSVPIEVFECAQDVSLGDWVGTVERLSAFIPGVRAFSSSLPLKRATLKPRFLADLLTRYVGIHIRLGSPDFSSQTVAKYIEQIGG